MFIHRILSWFLILLLIWPLWIARCIINWFFNVINSLHYHNFWHQIPLHEKVTEGTLMAFSYRIVVIIVQPFTIFIQELLELKKTKW